MLRAAWTAIAVLAVAHLLALGGFVGWLAATDRLSAERVEAVRRLFVETVPEEQARLAREERERASAELAAAHERLPQGPPLTGEQTLGVRLAVSEMDRQRLARMEREKRDIQESIDRRMAELQAAREQLERERRSFDALRNNLRQIEGDEQFRKSLAVLETVKAEDAKAMLSELLVQGETDKVVAFLNAMQERTRAKVMAEFVDAGETRVAADLLERLRTFGLAGPES